MPTGLVIDGSNDSVLTLWRVARDDQVSTAAMGSRDLGKVFEANEVLVIRRVQFDQVARFRIVSNENTEHRIADQIQIEKRDVREPVVVIAGSE